MKGCVKELKELLLSSLSTKEYMENEDIKEEDNKIKAQLPSLLFKEEVIKRAIIDKEDDEIEIGFRVLGIFSVVNDVELGKTCVGAKDE